MKRVLVTGASGFIGRHTLTALRARGFEVHANSRGLAADPEGGVAAHPLDLLGPGGPAALVRDVQPSHLLHLAWAPPSRSWMTLDNLSWAAASLELYRAFAEAGGRRAVVAGSCAEYDWSYETLCEADTPARPRSLYGCAKNAVREVVAAAARQSGISTAWARIFFVYGPHEPPGRLVPEVADALLSGRVAETTHGRQQRDFMHVADVAAALAALLDGEVTGIVNIASGSCVAVRHVVEHLGRLAGRPDLLAIGARPVGPGEPARLAADVGRLSREVGFSPRYGLEEGLADALEWWRRAGKPD